MFARRPGMRRSCSTSTSSDARRSRPCAQLALRPRRPAAHAATCCGSRWSLSRTPPTMRMSLTNVCLVPCALARLVLPRRADCAGFDFSSGADIARHVALSRIDVPNQRGSAACDSGAGTATHACRPSKAEIPAPCHAVLLPRASNGQLGQSAVIRGPGLSRGPVAKVPQRHGGHARHRDEGAGRGTGPRHLAHAPHPRRRPRAHGLVGRGCRRRACRTRAPPSSRRSSTS